MGSRLSRTWKRHDRRLFSLIALLGICASQFPISLQTPIAADKIASTPFPCQHCACGCQTAAQCWRNCCCFTNSQKVAWARAHGVEPPEFVIAAAHNEEFGSGGKKKVCRCCLAKSKSCGDHAEHVATCRKSCAENQPSSPGMKKDPSKVVFGIVAQECQGQLWEWSALPTLVFPLNIVRIDCLASTGERLPLDSHRLSSRVLEPPEPPPRLYDAANFEV